MRYGKSSPPKGFSFDFVKYYLHPLGRLVGMDVDGLVLRMLYYTRGPFHNCTLQRSTDQRSYVWWRPAKQWTEVFSILE